MQAKTSLHTTIVARPGNCSLPTVSIVIKALDEEAKIAKCIESTVAALGEIENPSEIILADSVSSDGTVEIARHYPVTIVQFERVEDRGCGAAVQLGYQHSKGDFVMLLDGDMEMLPGFLPVALARLDADRTLAGVAGLIEDVAIRNTFDRQRVMSGASNAATRDARLLNGGGLYRRRAISDAGGYAADRNLKAWEEAELGMRLRAKGWALERIDFPAIRHTGHAAGSAELLASRWRSRRAMANGVLLRQAFGTPWILDALALLVHPILILLLWCGALLTAAISVVTSQWIWLAGYAGALVCFVLLVIAHKRSVKYGLISLALWHYMAAALVIGFRERIVPPTEPIRSLKLSSPQGG